MIALGIFARDGCIQKIFDFARSGGGAPLLLPGSRVLVSTDI